MTFPLDIRTELKLDGIWTDISPDVYYREVMQITRGIPDQASTADPSSLKMTLNNRGGKYSQRNASSPLFGKIGRNTQTRVSVPGVGDSYLQVDGSSGQNATTPDTAALDITADLDIRWEGEADWYRPEAQMLIGKWGLAGNRSYSMRLQDGSLFFLASRDGTGAVFMSWQLPTLPERAALRGTLDADNGSGGWVMRLYWAYSIDGPWTEFGTPVVGVTPVTIHNSTAPLTIAPEQPDTDPIRPPMTGRVYRAEVRNGINGSIVAAPDFRSLADGATSFTDSAGRPWTLNGGAEIRDREDRFVGEISEWPTRSTPDDADVWTPVQASGVLRRLGQGLKPLESTLRRRIPSGDPIAYWPFEEAAEATYVASPIEGTFPVAVRGMEFASWSTLVSSAPLPRLTNFATMFATVRPEAPGQWQVEFVYNADSKIPPASGSYAPVITYHTRGGSIRRWQISMKSGTARVQGYDAEDTELIDQGVGIADDVFQGWVRLRFWARDNTNGTFDWRIAWQDVGGDAGGLTSTQSGVCGSIARVSSVWGALTEGWGFGHLAVFRTAANTTLDGSDDAYSGEDAAQRMYRLTTEEGIPFSRTAGPLTPALVGYQRPETVLNLLDAAAAADGGMLTEDMRRLALRYRDRSNMYSQEPALTLSYVEPGLGPDLEPVDDDSETRNDVTVTRDGGSSGRAIQESGPLSVATIGQYNTEYTLSLDSDDQTEPHAYWRLHLGTFDGARYPQVTVMLHKPGAAGLVKAILAMREGDKIRLTDLPAHVSNDDVDLIVNGWSEYLDRHRWEITFNCLPGGPWDVGVVGDGRLARADASEGSSSLAVPVSSTTTQIAVHTAPVGDAAPATWVTSRDRLTSNADFEIDLSGWTATGATIDRVATPGPSPFAGDWSIQITPSGSAVNAYAESGSVGVSAGSTYSVHAWVRCAVARTINLNVNWFTAASSYLSTSNVSVSVAANTWTQITGPVTAPASAGRATILPSMGGTPPTSHVLHADVVFLSTASATSLAGSAKDLPFDIRVAGEVMRVRWSEPGAWDNFNRTLSGTWGTADVGSAWTENSGAASDRSTNGTAGVITLAANRDTIRFQRIISGIEDSEVLVRMSADQVATGSSMVPSILLRYVDTSSYYRARLHFGTSGSLFTSITRGTAEVGASQSLPYTYAAGQWFWVRARITGQRVQMRVWPDGQMEPSAWNRDVTVTTSPIAAGDIGLTASAFSANTNTNAQLRYDNFQVVTPQLMTVQRSVNGVAKAQAAGAGVVLAQPTIVAL
ncbi:carbohydrate binding domain-containing protein [Streptomyces sp. NPDC000851]